MGTVAKKRIQVYAEADIKRRIEVAALKQGIAVTDYCLQAIQERLHEEDMLERSHVEIAVDASADDPLMESIRALRAEILENRKGIPLNPDILEQIRAERDEELIGLY